MADPQKTIANVGEASVATPTDGKVTIVTEHKAAVLQIITRTKSAMITAGRMAGVAAVAYLGVNWSEIVLGIGSNGDRPDFNSLEAYGLGAIQAGAIGLGAFIISRFIPRKSVGAK